jgi:hypothetical protein
MMTCYDNDKPHTFAEAVTYLTAEDRPTNIDYEVEIAGHHGALMTREVWLEAVEQKSFIDYDGMGNEIDEQGNMLGRVAAVWSGEPGKSALQKMGDPAYIYPSTASKIRPETKYILWYNR